MKFLSDRATSETKLPSSGGIEQVHVWSDREVAAVDTALAARRALLVRGEPGTGKTQLALAAATALGWKLVPFVVDSRTESRELMWRFDAVSRLADAQIMGANENEGRSDPKKRSDSDTTLARLRERLDVANYIWPGPLWWAFDWDGAQVQQQRVSRLSQSATPAEGKARSGSPPGVVLLIDEIDKADADIPNGLLEALGSATFTPLGFSEPVVPRLKTPPLVIITTNEERALPDAFVRRCVVLHLRLPEQRIMLKEHLISRGRAHFPKVDKTVLEAAADAVIDDRQEAERQNWRPLPGQAEFIDLVRALKDLSPGPAQQIELLERTREFILRKHPQAPLPSNWPRPARPRAS